MAISIVGRPQDFTPVYNPVNYYVDSTNKLNQGFRYVFELYDVETGLKISETRGAPRPIDGYGETYLSRLLAPLVTRRFTPTFVVSTDAEENYIRYQLSIGEEYLLQWRYSDYEYYNNSSSQYNGYCQLRQFTASGALSHSFTVGDQINVVQNDGGALKPILNGLHTIVEIVDAWTIVIDLTFSAVGSGAAVEGVVTYADNRKEIFRNLVQELGVAYNGAFRVQEFRVLDNEVFKINTNDTGKRLLTTVPQTGFKIAEDADLWLNFGKADASFLVGAFYAYFENSNGDVFRKVISSGGALKYIRQFYAGASGANLQLVSGTAGLVKSDSSYYEVWVANSSGLQLSVKYRFGIDRRCRIEDFIVLFEDRLGSLIPLSFQLNSEKTTEYERLEYLSNLEGLVRPQLGEDGELGIGSWTHETYGEGKTTVDVQEQITYLLRSNWMSREEFEYFEELLGSPTTLILLDGVYVSCKVKTLSTMTRGRGNRKITRKDLLIGLSNQNPVNI